MKKVFASILCMILVIGCFNINALAAEIPEETKEQKYEVYNGYGELLYVADSLEEAEEYLGNHCGNERSARLAYKIGKLTVKEVLEEVGIVKAICVAYRVGDYFFGDGELIDIANEIVPISTLWAIANTIYELHLYSNTPNLSNPYPPNSYQGAQWVRNTFYYIVPQ